MVQATYHRRKACRASQKTEVLPKEEWQSLFSLRVAFDCYPLRKEQIRSCACTHLNHIDQLMEASENDRLVKASLLEHRKEKRIRVDLPADDFHTTGIKAIPGRRWSRTHRCWHLPYSKEAFAQLKERFPSLEVITSRVLSPTNRQPAHEIRPISVEKHPERQEAAAGEAVTVTILANKRKQVRFPFHPSHI